MNFLTIHTFIWSISLFFCTLHYVILSNNLFFFLFHWLGTPILCPISYIITCLDEDQQVTKMMIGSIGTSVSLIGYFLGTVISEFFPDSIFPWILILGSMWCFTISHQIFSSGSITFLIRDNVGMKVKWLRSGCMFLAILPFFVYFSKCPYFGGFACVCAFHSYFEACRTHRSRLFHRFVHECVPGCGRPFCVDNKDRKVGIVEIGEEDRKKMAYRFMDCIDFLTEFD